jgi:hypothetical protein
MEVRKTILEPGTKLQPYESLRQKVELRNKYKGAIAGRILHTKRVNIFFDNEDDRYTHLYNEGELILLFIN